MSIFDRLTEFVQQLIDSFDDALDVFDEDEPIPYLPVEVVT